MRVTVLAVALSLIVSVLPVSAQAVIRHYQLNIPRQPLDAALKDFAHQTGLQVARMSDRVDGSAIVGPVTGDLSAEEALKSLLDSKGLSYMMVNERTVAIVKAGDKTASSAAVNGEKATNESDNKEETQSKSFWDRFRVAQVDQGAALQPSSVTSTTSTTQEGLNKVGLEEVVVTAQKRAERVFDVPMSIVALSGDELQKRNITSIDDLSLAVPGIGGMSNGGYARYIFLRGVANVVGNSSLVGLYLDESDVTALPSWWQPDLRTYDLERVEVLRGPQGTLYGEGSVGGTIRFITKNPQLNTFAMAADVATLYTQDGSPSQRVESVVNVPLIANELGVRIAATSDHEGGWIDQPAANVKDYNGQNALDVRTKVLWQVSPQFTVNAMALVDRKEGGPSFGEDANGNYTQTFGLTSTPNFQNNYDVYSLTLSYDFSAARLLSSTSYMDMDNDERNRGYVLERGPPPTTPNNVFWPLRVLTQSILNEEIRLTSTGSGPWEWTIGGFYRHARYADDSPDGVNFGLPGLPNTPLPSPISPFNLDYNGLSESRAIFGDTSYKLMDRLTLGVGLRYYEDDQDYYTAGTSQTGTFHALNPRGYIQYKLTDQINTYASASKGFRSGGFNQLNQPTYGPETVWTYELGTKMSFGGGRLSFNPALFYSNYTGYQTSGVLPPPALPLNITSNAGNALIKGIEWSLDWRMADQWTLGFNGDYVETAFTRIYATQTSYDVGDPLDYTPKYEFNISVQRDFACAAKACFTRLDYEQQGRSTYRNRALGNPWYFSESDVIHMLNFNSGLQWSENLSIGLSVQNLLNDRGYTSPDSIEDFAERARPRTYGVNFGVKF